MSEKEEVKEISDWERKRRENIVRQARASVELEGFVIGDDDKQEEQDYINGKISMAELSEISIKRIDALAREYFAQKDKDAIK